MAINFYSLKNIDFSNKDNIFFLIIFAVIFLIIIFIIFVVLLEIIKILRKIISLLASKIFKNSQLVKNKSEEQAPKIGGDKKSELLEISPKPKITGGNFTSIFTDKKDKVDGGDNKDNSHKEVQSKGMAEGSEKPKINQFGNASKSEGKVKDVGTSYKEKEAKSISEHLGKLKKSKDEQKDSLASKMPSRGGNQEEVEEGFGHGKIKIPKQKRFSENGDQSSQASGTNIINYGSQPNGASLFSKKHGVVGETLKSINLSTSPIKVPTNEKILSKKQQTDTSIFEGKPEVPKTKLVQKMRLDPKIWQASRQVGLTLSPVERSKLIKEVFSPALGRNISKPDLKFSIRKLNRKMLGTKDQKEHEKIRKEIKFFKKIGGIK